MRIMERVKSMIRNWLEIQPASAKGFTIREPISFETNVISWTVSGIAAPSILQVKLHRNCLLSRKS